jgi:predicted DCC family thiol-disulfide oxidoreductase YuxK
VKATPPAWVLFDGECGLCDRSVQWLLRRDRGGALRFGALAGGAAAAVRARHPELPSADESIVLVEAPDTATERVRVRSDAALAILARLGGPWRFAGILRVVPRPLRDLVYGAVARRRRRWFGRLAACRIPTPEERARFLDGAAEAESGADNFVPRPTYR